MQELEAELEQLASEHDQKRQTLVQSQIEQNTLQSSQIFKLQRDLSEQTARLKQAELLREDEKAGKESLARELEAAEADVMELQQAVTEF